ncbi:MAG: hypothetical protein GF384_00265, partial [Elusimicrobia bacterium]|nr:hypothetical protein [Elusimicrobiota bacterium]MBD3411530.1 hypothetical protein [Elusimicrobiota bacterium]
MKKTFMLIIAVRLVLPLHGAPILENRDYLASPGMAELGTTNHDGSSMFINQPSLPSPPIFPFVRHRLTLDSQRIADLLAQSQDIEKLRKVSSSALLTIMEKKRASTISQEASVGIGGIWLYAPDILRYFAPYTIFLVSDRFERSFFRIRFDTKSSLPVTPSGMLDLCIINDRFFTSGITSYDDWVHLGQHEQQILIDMLLYYIKVGGSVLPTGLDSKSLDFLDIQDCIQILRQRKEKLLSGIYQEEEIITKFFRLCQYLMEVEILLG